MKYKKNSSLPNIKKILQRLFQEILLKVKNAAKKSKMIKISQILRLNLNRF